MERTQAVRAARTRLRPTAAVEALSQRGARHGERAAAHPGLRRSGRDAGRDQRRAAGRLGRVPAVTIGAIHHVAVVVRSIDESLPRYERLFGWRPERAPFDFPSAGRAPLLHRRPATEPTHGSSWCEPIDPDGGVARFLAARGEGVHHVCLLSDDLPADLAALAAAEAELIDREPRTGCPRQRRLHPSAHPERGTVGAPRAVRAEGARRPSDEP